MHQIFPDSAEVALGPEVALSSGDLKERLPYIVVEPIDLSPQESEEHCWPQESMASLEEEDIFQELYTRPAHLTDWQGEELEDVGNEEGSPNNGGVQRRQSNPLATAQLSCSRLTLPPVSQCPEEMPPCLRS
ncbi:hypothetical protein SKAU_G00326740 [Synaphobranchus kaupii]|uniref:LBH domain-containing protein n=1 Tax=Synaphobranchus kaupii TaxID=118154 RepID=A0A9Q1EPR4_SYNKA|nr:hypothetical protein SKAU_G00326740 [Synaphobranchus kaupii]